MRVRARVVVRVRVTRDELRARVRARARVRVRARARVRVRAQAAHRSIVRGGSGGRSRGGGGGAEARIVRRLQQRHRIDPPIRAAGVERDVQRVGGEAGEGRWEVNAVHALAHAVGEPPHAHRLVERGRCDERVHAALGNDQGGHR